MNNKMRKSVIIVLSIALLWNVGMVAYAQQNVEEGVRIQENTEEEFFNPEYEDAVNGKTEPIKTEYGDALYVQIIESEYGTIRVFYLKDDETERVTITDRETSNYIIKGTLNKRTEETIFQDIPKPGVWGIMTTTSISDITGSAVLSKSFVIPKDAARTLGILMPLSVNAVRLAQSATLND